MNTNKQTGEETMNESYKDKFNAQMKKAGIDSLGDLKTDAEKKAFFKAVDAAHTAKNESMTEELLSIAQESINEMKDMPEMMKKEMAEMMKEMMKEMSSKMEMLKAEVDPTKVETMKKEMMTAMKKMPEMAKMSEMMKSEMMKEMSKKMNEYGSMNAMKEELTAGQKKLPPALQKAIAAKQGKKETKEAVSPAQQAAIAISKKEKGMKETHDCNKVHPDQSHSEYMKTESENMEEKHVPGHDDDTSEMMNAMKMNAMKMPITATYGKMNSMKTGDDDLTPMNNMKLNAMIKDPHKSKEDNPKKDLNATYMKSDVRADVKNNGGTDMSKVQDAPKMMTAMKKINAMYKTEKYHETKPGSIHDAVAQMQMNEQKIVSIKVKEFTKMVETYLLKGGVIDTTSVNEDVDLNEEINALHLNEVRGFIETYNKWFLTNYRAEEFIISEKVDAAGAMGAEPKKVGTIAKIAKGISYATQPIRNFIKGKGMKMDIDVKKKEYPAGSVGARTKTNVFGIPKKNQ